MDVTGGCCIAQIHFSLFLSAYNHSLKLVQLYECLFIVSYKIWSTVYISKYMYNLYNNAHSAFGNLSKVRYLHLAKKNISLTCRNPEDVISVALVLIVLGSKFDEC